MTTAAATLETEIQTFERLLPGLLAEEVGRHALIHGQDFQGAFDTERDAIMMGYKNNGNVPFLVRIIVPDQVPATFTRDIF